MQATSNTVVDSFGMGVDSVAYMLRCMHEPGVINFDLRRDLLLVTAMTGNEHPQTGEYMERYMLPLFAEHGIRYVQLARAGQAKSHGYVVLSDSRTTKRMVMEGPWRLDHEMRAVGTVPSVRNKRRWCSIRAKGDPLDWWVADHCAPGYTHITGYAFDEQWRADRDRQARKEKLERGKALACVPSYPLIDWEWDREQCERYILDVLGVRWPRSCCTYCPFQETAGTRDELAGRWRAEPAAGADALELEYTSLALNPRVGLFGVNSTAHDFAVKRGLQGALDLADRRINGAPTWSTVDVRRVFDAKEQNPSLKGQPWRSTRVVENGTRDDMLAALRTFQRAEIITDERGYTRAWRERLPPNGVTYPATEWFQVVVPAGVLDKQLPGFESVWWRAHMDPLF